jgi:retron-type reverse transcriptase
MRPLGLPTWSDKLVGEVIRLLLDAYYEPTFSDRSHGFRAGRGCHSALKEVTRTWTGTTWFIEADVVDCFGSLDHEVMLSTLAENIHDGRFLRLLRRMLNAGYLEDWVWKATLSGAPQGSLCAAAHKPPNEQCWVMRSVGLLGLVSAGLGVERCA